MRDAYEIERAAYAIADTTARYAASTAAIGCSAITNSLFFPREFDVQTAEFCGFLTETGWLKVSKSCKFPVDSSKTGKIREVESGSQLTASSTSRSSNSRQSGSMRP
ncbi:MAG TPA: hypothetical protein VLM36_11230 [Sphingomicrobium sp.]|nr:hypothetical protein [Sphingomicrobium sp.]